MLLKAEQRQALGVNDAGVSQSRACDMEKMDLQRFQDSSRVDGSFYTSSQTKLEIKLK